MSDNERSSSANKRLGKTVKEAREKLELTQKQVADKVGVHPNWFARFERREESLVAIRYPLGRYPEESIRPSTLARVRGAFRFPQ